MIPWDRSEGPIRMKTRSGKASRRRVILILTKISCDLNINNTSSKSSYDEAASCRGLSAVGSFITELSSILRTTNERLLPCMR